MAEHDLLVATRPAAGVDLGDAGAVRRWLCAEIEARGFAPNEPTLWFLAADRVEVVECPEPELRERVLSFAFADWSRRHAVVRAFWVGDARVPVEGGRRRAVCVLERADDGSWWTAWRLVRYDAATRQSSLVGPWHEASGEPGDALTEPYDAWLAPAALAENVEAPDVRVGTGRLDEDLPDGAGAVLETIARLLYRQVVDEGGLDCDVIAVFQDREFRVWEIRGALPAPFDDLVRTLARGADAVVVLRGEGADVVAVAEVGRDRAGHRLDLSGPRVTAFDAGDRRWLGVLPRTPIELRAEGGWSADTGDA